MLCKNCFFVCLFLCKTSPSFANTNTNIYNNSHGKLESVSSGGDLSFYQDGEKQASIEISMGYKFVMWSFLDGTYIKFYGDKIVRYSAITNQLEKLSLIGYRNDYWDISNEARTALNSIISSQTNYLEVKRKSVTQPLKKSLRSRMFTSSRHSNRDLNSCGYNNYILETASYNGYQSLSRCTRTARWANALASVAVVGSCFTPPNLSNRWRVL